MDEVVNKIELHHSNHCVLFLTKMVCGRLLFTDPGLAEAIPVAVHLA
jgi:hypothetical protein